MIVSDTGGLKEIVEPGLGGLTVPPNDPRPLAAAIVQLLYNPQAAAGLAAQGRDRALAAYGWDDVAKRTLTVYENALGER